VWLVISQSKLKKWDIEYPTQKTRNWFDKMAEHTFSSNGLHLYEMQKRHFRAKEGSVFFADRFSIVKFSTVVFGNFGIEKFA